MIKMNYQPLVSVIIPAYNCENYITQAVECVKKQSYQNWELIIIDDCSMDQTWKMVQDFANDKIFVYRNEKNEGVSQTRNRGIEIAKADWIAFLDSDDLWMPDKLEKQINLVNQKENVALIFTASGFMTESGTRIKNILHVPEKITRNQLLKQNLISCSSVLVKKVLVLKYPFPTYKMIHEDFAVWLQILKDITFAFGINEPLLIYRLSAASKSGNKFRAARMNWNTYRYVKLNTFTRCFYMSLYTINGVKKYMKISWEVKRTF